MLCIAALRPRAEPAEVRLTVWVLIAVHAASAVAEAITAATDGISPVVVANLVLRLVLVALLLVCLILSPPKDILSPPKDRPR